MSLTSTFDTLAPDSTATIYVGIKGAKRGGELKLPFYNENYDESAATLKVG